MQLTYSKGEFTLVDGGLNEVVEILKSGKWKQVNPDDYVTLDFKAAARFKAFADDKAGRILNRAFVKRYEAPSSPLPLFLDPHQTAGVTWVLTRSRSYLAHAPGAGKTCEAIIAALNTAGTGQVLFVVPPSLTRNWAREIDLWWGKTQESESWPSVSVIPESKHQHYTGWNADFIICPDSMLTRPWVMKELTARNFKFIAVDEASRFKEQTAERTRALFGGILKDGRSAPGLVFKPRHAVLLDGSPMPNRPIELYAPTWAMSPESIDFMTEEEFGFRYCGARINDYGRWEFKYSSNEAELQSKLQKTFMHVVTEEKLSHPERRRSILYMTKDARSAEHRRWERKNLSKLALDTLDENASQGELAKFRQELGLRKVKWIADYVTDRLATKGESILLFAWHREVCKELQKALTRFDPGLVMGGTQASAREFLFEEFQSGKKKLIIGNIAAMGRGHNLQRADRIIFGEYSWCDETNKQCEKRASRKGSTKSFVRCEYIVCPNSMDERILNAVMRKADSVRKVIG